MKTKLTFKSFNELFVTSLTPGSSHRPAEQLPPDTLPADGNARLPMPQSLVLIQCTAPGRWLPVTVHMPCPGAE